MKKNKVRLPKFNQQVEKEVKALQRLGVKFSKNALREILDVNLQKEYTSPTDCVTCLMQF